MPGNNDLKAIVVHHRGTPYGGHYTTFIRQKSDKTA